MINHMILNFINSSRVFFKQFKREFGASADVDKEFGDELKGLISKGIIERRKNGYFLISEDSYYVVVEISRAFFEDKVVKKLASFFKLDKKPKGFPVISLKNYNIKRVIAEMIIVRDRGHNAVKLTDIPAKGLDASILKALDKLNLCIQK